MKFLDSNGLTHFWSKIKDWSNSNFFSNEGGEISPKSGLHYIINGKQLDVSKTGNENESTSIFNVDENGISAKRIVMTGGTATQVLMADGSVKTLNANNGIAGLDSNGNVPLAQLGNLDTTVAEVVTTLPTTNIKKHIYLIKNASNVTQNKYEEYIYTGDTSATYDDSKWEKLGDFRATVDFADYARKSEAITRLVVDTDNAGDDIVRQYIGVYKADDSDIKVDEINLLNATTYMSGLMHYGDKYKLDNIEFYANNYSLPLATASLRGGIQVGYAANGKNYPVQLAGEKAYVNVPWTDTTYDLTPYAKKNEAVGMNNIEIFEEVLTVDPQGQKLAQAIRFSDVNNAHTLNIKFKDASSNMNGFMSISDKNKLDAITFGATADSAITTAEIDALFA